MKYAWIDKHRQDYSTTLMCELLAVSRSGLNAARVRVPSKRAQDDERLLAQVRQAQRRHRGRYGRRRMATEISQAQGRAVNEKRVAWVMREHGLQSHKRRRFRVVTTDSKHAYPVAPNVLERDFEATAPNQKRLADTTYVPTKEGWLYLALVLDLYARKLVGWAMSETMPQELTLAALDMALGWRDPDADLVHYSDRGSQYVSIRHSERLAEAGVEPSLGSKGDSYDNALAETINGLYKAELIHRRAPWKTKEAVELATLEWVAWFNNHRLLEPIGYIPSAEAEANYYRHLASQPATVAA